jgi:hypothetical protein
MPDVIFSVERGPENEITVRFKPKALQLVPPLVGEHLRSAKKEVLLAVKHVLTQAITAIEHEEKKGKEKTEVEIQ